MQFEEPISFVLVLCAVATDPASLTSLQCPVCDAPRCAWGSNGLFRPL